MTPEKYVVFSLDDRRFGLPLLSVERILAAPELTRVPRSPKEMRGVFDLRGEILPVLDTRTLLGLEERPPRCLLVVHSGDRRLALTADRVDSIVDLEGDKVESLMADTGHEVRVATIGEHLALLLDLNEVVSQSLGKRATNFARQAA
ncbi:MAG: chemotaxis protein CheW [Fimbriimonas sp.]